MAKEKTAEILKKEILDNGNIPQHIAIIMDGNGRWAKMKGKPRIMGHRAGVKTVREIVKACGSIGVKVLTLYAFSSENWKRPFEEISALMELLKYYLHKERDELHRNNVKLTAIGRLYTLDPVAQKELQQVIDYTSKNTGLNLNLALSYGGRCEIVDAVNKIIDDYRNGKLTTDKIDEKTFSQYLYTANLPDPDLLIRTSGEMRISNFLPWQIAYTEIWVTDVFWPDFKREHLFKAISDYQKRDRRFGNIKN